MYHEGFCHYKTILFYFREFDSRFRNFEAIHDGQLSGCGFESRCCQLNFRYGACFEQGVP